MKCILEAWKNHESELRHFVRARIPGEEEASDLVQEVFLRAQSQHNGLCDIANPRAWLFQVARNLLIDRYRLHREMQPLDEDFPAKSEVEALPVDALADCLPRVLAELSPEDREAISLCDIEGLSQQAFATRAGLSLPAAKARVQRARKRLRSQLIRACQVHFDEMGKVCCFVPSAGNDRHD